MNPESKKKIKGAIVICLFLFVIGGIFFGMWKDTLPQTYVVGTIQDWYKPLKGDYSVNFEYYYNGEKVESFAKAGNYLDQLREGDKYLVSIPEGYPKSGRLLLEFPVPDNVEAPEEGWDELPKFAR